MAPHLRPLGAYRLKRRVQFQETDQAGIVHFTNFFRYMEEAEHALWRAAGLSIAVPGGEVGWPRVATSFEYHRPLRFEDEIEIEIRVAEITEQTIRYVCRLWRGEEKVATGSLAIVCVSRKPHEPLRAVPIPPDIKARFRVAPEEEQVEVGAS